MRLCLRLRLCASLLLCASLRLCLCLRARLRLRFRFGRWLIGRCRIRWRIWEAARPLGLGKPKAAYQRKSSAGGFYDFAALDPLLIPGSGRSRASGRFLPVAPPFSSLPVQLSLPNSLCSAAPSNVATSPAAPPFFSSFRVQPINRTSVRLALFS